MFRSHILSSMIMDLAYTYYCSLRRSSLFQNKRTPGIYEKVAETNKEFLFHIWPLLFSHFISLHQTYRLSLSFKMHIITLTYRHFCNHCVDCYKACLDCTDESILPTCPFYNQLYNFVEYPCYRCLDHWGITKIEWEELNQATEEVRLRRSTERERGP